MQEAAARRPRKKERKSEQVQADVRQEATPQTAPDRKRAPNPERTRRSSGYMGYRVDPESGDTVYFSSISPSWVFANGRDADDSQWRKYYRLVYNFNKVYPYALVGKKLEHIADSTIQARQMSRREKEKYVNGIQKELVNVFEKPLKNLTVSQGALLIRLVDREVGDTGYDIIKDYKSGLAAGFWQGVAKMFSNNLKTHYDPDGEDRQTEELVQMWHSGQFPAFYYSIFFQYPRVTEIPEKYR